MRKMQTSKILAADPDDIIRVRPDALDLLGITNYAGWLALVRSGEIAVFQPARGRNGAYVQMSALQDYVNRLAARAEEQRRKRQRATHRRSTAA